MQKSEIRRKRPVPLPMLIVIRRLISTSIQQVEISVTTNKAAYMNTTTRINTNAVIQRFEPILVQPCLLIQTRMKILASYYKSKMKQRLAIIPSPTQSLVLMNIANKIHTNINRKTKGHTKIILISALRLMLMLGELPGNKMFIRVSVLKLIPLQIII